MVGSPAHVSWSESALDVRWRVHGFLKYNKPEGAKKPEDHLLKHTNRMKIFPL